VSDIARGASHDCRDRTSLGVRVQIFLPWIRSLQVLDIFCAEHSWPDSLLEQTSVMFTGRVQTFAMVEKLMFISGFF